MTKIGVSWFEYHRGQRKFSLSHVVLFSFPGQRSEGNTRIYFSSLKNFITEFHL